MKQRTPMKPKRQLVSDRRLRDAVIRQARASQLFMSAYKSGPAIKEYMALRQAEQDIHRLGEKLLAARGKGKR
jgi:hypothetical protein